MISIILFVSAPAFICPGNPSIEEIKRQKALYEMIEQDASQYLSCKSSEDCYHLPHAGGHIVGISGLPAVAYCADRLGRALFPTCYNPGMSGIHWPQRKVPKEILCEAGRCVGRFVENADKWAIAKMERPWMNKYAKFLKKRLPDKLDSLCEGFVRDSGALIKLAP